MRFAGVGVVNTAIDVALFLLLHEHLGIVLANFISTTAGMTFGFVAHGLFTFSSRRLTLRQAWLFLATNGVSMWLVQPLVIWTLLALLPTFTGVALGAKLTAIAVSLVVNFLAYRYVVWPITQRHPETAAAETGGAETPPT